MVDYFRHLLFATLVVMVLSCCPAQAQNVGAVFGPDVTRGETATEYRIAWAPEGDAVRQRIHFEHAISDNLRPRLVVQGSSGPGNSFDVDFMQGELFWQLTADGQKYETGFRFDARIPLSGGPGGIGANWTNQLNLGGGWNARAVVLTAVDIGDGRRNGIFLQSRFRLAKQLSGRLSIAGELYDYYGSTSGLSRSSDQLHQIGPIAHVKIGHGFVLSGGALFGLTQATANHELRLWIGKSF